MIITKTDNKNMAYIDSYGVEYSDDQKTLIKCPTSLRGSYTVSSKVKTIGENAFNKCIELTCINLQEGLEIIEKWAFSGCNGLTSLVIPRSVNRIEQEAFVWCDSLKKIRIESDNITIVNDAFNGCNNIISLEVTDGVKYESRGAVVDIDMLMRGGESAEHFKKYWFALSNIKGISFLQGTKTINSEMLKLFDGIEVVFIPSSVREIYRTAFENAHSLSKIVVDDDNEFFESQDGVLFDKGGKKLLYVPRKTSGTFVVPNTVTTIDQWALKDCILLESIVIPASVKTIGRTESVFSGCNSLKTIIVNEQNTSYSAIEGILYDYNKETIIRCPENKTGCFEIPLFVTTIDSGAFWACKHIDSITIPEGVVKVGESAFSHCDRLENLIISSTVVEIGINSFPDALHVIQVSPDNKQYSTDGKLLFDKQRHFVVFACKDITGHIDIPEGIECVVSGAFINCKELQSVSFPSSLLYVNSNAFFGCKQLEIISFNEGVKVLGELSFGCCDNLKEVLLPNSLVRYQEAFDDWRLESLSIPVGTKMIFTKGNSCWHLRSVRLNDGFETIGKDLFKECKAVVDITMPASVKTVEANALDDCKALKNIHYEGTLKEWLAMKWSCFVKNGYNLYIQGELLTEAAFDGSVPEIRNNAFYYCSSLRHIDIKEGVKTIGKSSFNKTGIIGDTFIPDSVEYIDEFAFLNCLNLKSISLSISTGIGNGVFRYCDNLESIIIRGEKPKDVTGSYYFGYHFTDDGVLFHYAPQLHTEFTGWTCYEVGISLYPCGKKETKYIIPKEVKYIEDYAFAGVSNLTLVFREFISVEKNTFLNANVKIQVPIGSKHQFINHGYPEDSIIEMDVNKYLDAGRVKERCHELVCYNPYRMLGVFADATLKEITANKTKATRYASVGKTVSFDADFDNLLPPINRTTEGIEQAFADLSLPQDKVKYALTWFVKGGSMDGVAIDHIKSGNYNKASEILEKKETWSSLLNQGALALAKKDAENAVASITKMIHNEEYRNAFVTSVCGDSYKIEEDELAHIFIDLLLDGNETSAFIELFEQNGEAAEDDDYIKTKLTEAPVGRIKAAVAKAKNVDPNDSAASYAAGKALMEDTRSDLGKLKSLSGDDAIYGMMADSLAKQILQCGINYYNESNDDQYERIDKAKELQEYALSIAVGSIIKSRCQENVNILHDIQSKIPPRIVKPSVDKINELLDHFEDEKKVNLQFSRTLLTLGSGTRLDTCAGAIKLIKDCEPFLVAVKEELGANNVFYVSLSTMVANVALNFVIDYVNSAKDDPLYKIDSSLMIKSYLVTAWQTMLYIKTLELENDFKTGRFEENYRTLKGIIERSNGFTRTGAARDFYVFGRTLKVDLDLRTETEHYINCTHPAACRTYIEKFPKGKYVDKVKQKLKEFEKNSWDKCKNYQDYKKHREEFPHGYYYMEAGKKMEELEERTNWAVVKHIDTIDGYNEYLELVSGYYYDNPILSQHITEAKGAIERIKEEQQKDETKWKTCEKKSDFEEYLKTYPNGLHKEDANNMLKKIANRKNTLILVAVGLGIGIMITLITLLK